MKIRCMFLGFLILIVSNLVYADRDGWGGHSGHHHGGHHFGGHHYGGGWGYGPDIYFGGIGFGYGNYAPYPYYNYPPTVVTVPVAPPVYVQEAPVAPPIYIQQSAPPVQASQQYPAGYWYHCSNPEGYYPYVKDCPAGWQQVAPSPASKR